MSENMVAEILAAHADHLAGDKANGEDYLDLFPAYRSELGPLLRVAERVKAALAPVTPSPEFKVGLKQDLLAAAVRRVEERKVDRRVSFLNRRRVLIGAAVGSVLSVAGIIAALIWRQRTMARV